MMKLWWSYDFFKNLFFTWFRGTDACETLFEETLFFAESATCTVHGWWRGVRVKRHEGGCPQMSAHETASWSCPRKWGLERKKGWSCPRSVDPMLLACPRSVHVNFCFPSVCLWGAFCSGCNSARAKMQKEPLYSNWQICKNARQKVMMKL